MPKETTRQQHSIHNFDHQQHANADIAAIHLSIRQWQVANQNNQFPDIYSSQSDLSKIQEYYIDPGGNFFIAQQDSKTVGFVALRNEGEGVGAIKRLAVLPAYHRRGIATSLMQAAIQWARDQGFVKLKLSTGVRENAKPIYEQAGFKVIGRKDNQDYVMEFDLNS